MKRPKTIAIINPNTNLATTDMMAGLAKRYAPEVSFITLTAREGPPLITTPEALDVSIGEVVRMAENLLSGDARIDGIVVGAIGDPGLPILRELTAIPICGLADSALREAARRRLPFAIVTTTPGLSRILKDRVRAQGLGSVFKGIFFTADDPERTSRDANALLSALLLATNQAMAAGAKLVIVGGGPLSQAAEQLSTLAGIPIISPLKSALADILGRA